MIAPEHDRESEATPTLPVVTWYWEGERKAKRVPWLVNDLIPRKSVGLIVGESQAGKTFLGVDLSVAVAEGRPFFCKPVLQGGVIYVAAEGEFTIPGRLKAARQGKSITGKIAVIETVPDLMTKDGLAHLMAQIKSIGEKMLAATGRGIELVIIDTLVTAFGANNWNDAAEAGRVIRVLNEIKLATGAAVIGIHHHGKDTSRGAAGSHTLTAGPDWLISVFRNSKDDVVKDRFIRITKTRFGPTGKEYAFDLDSLPPDLREEDDDSLMFVVPLLDEQIRKSKRKIRSSPGDECFLKSFNEALNAAGQKHEHPEHGLVSAVKLSETKKIFLANYHPGGIGDRLDAGRKAWDRALSKCANHGIIREDRDGHEWLYQVVPVG